MKDHEIEKIALIISEGTGESVADCQSAARFIWSLVDGCASSPIETLGALRAAVMTLDTLKPITERGLADQKKN